MSELKVWCATIQPKMKNACDGAREVYLKADADKVIKEKDKEIASLKDSIEKLLKAKTEQVMDEVFQRCIIYGEGFVPVEHAMRLVAELRHQKYKRCLAMVEWCSYKSECFDQYSRHTDYLPNIEKYRRKRNHYADRCQKLLLLAEKFKEAK